MMRGVFFILTGGLTLDGASLHEIQQTEGLGGWGVGAGTAGG